VVFSFHDYCLAASVETAKSRVSYPVVCPLLNPLTWNNATATSTRMGAPQFLTEFGATDNPDELRSMTTLADQNLTGWTYWMYKSFNDPTTQSASTQSMFSNDSDLTTLKPGKADLLIRAYPQATAGIPGALSFDPVSGAFHYQYAPRPAAARTEIFVPSRHYPFGYTVHVTGAQVTSPAGALVLTLANLPGATSVTVDIARQ
jgi:endoglycosylceramidase